MAVQPCCPAPLEKPTSATDHGVPRRLAFVLALLSLGLALACGPRRPAFSDDDAQAQLAKAFERHVDEIAIYSSQHGSTPDEWLVEFRLDGMNGSLEARFSGETPQWLLKDVRESASNGEHGPWAQPSILVAKVRREMGDKAEATMKTMAELAQMLERYATENGHRYPTIDMVALRQLLADGHYTKNWHHDVDAWGKGLYYHAASDGEAYIIVSAGADQVFDGEPTSYATKTDAHEEAYGGVSADPKRDIIYATGAFAQSFSAGH